VSHRKPELEPLEDRTVPASVVPGFADALVAGGLTSPTSMVLADDGRIFITEKGGSLRVFAGGALQATPFVTLSVEAAGERGLLGVELDPNFAANNFVYVYYTVPASGPTPVHNRVSRFTANGNVAVAGSEVVLLEIDPPVNVASTVHNSGALHFGNDGLLYIASGDHGTPASSQSLGNLHGKILRIEADGDIPATNPFFNTATGDNRAIWALGLRNVFTFAVRPSDGVLFINDVGENTWEEINVGASGANYGWPNSEGPTTATGVTSPLFAYPHGPGELYGFAITGGAFYQPTTPTFPAKYANDYFFSDFVNGWIRHRDAATGVVATFAVGAANPLDIDVGDDGSLYYLEFGSGSVRRVAPAAGVTPHLDTVASPVNALLQWTAVPGATGYNVYRSVNGVGQLLASNFAGTSYSDFAVLSGFTYMYQVTAVNATLEGAASNASAETIPLSPFLQAVPNAPYVNLSWSATFGAGFYNVYRSANGGPSTLLASGLATTSLVDSVATAGVRYSYEVTAVVNGTETPRSNAVTVHMPTFLNVVTAANGSFLQWNAVGGASSYRVYRSTPGGPLTSLAQDLTGTSYTDAAVTSGATYTYWVTAVVAGQETALSNAVVRTVPPFVNALAGVGSVFVGWTATPLATSYNVYRSTVSGAEVLYRTGVTTTSLFDVGLVRGATYFYKVTAVVFGVETALSFEAAASVL